MRLEETLRRIERKLEKIEAELTELKAQTAKGMVANDRQLISLPDHLRKTALGLRRVGEGSAVDVSRCTNRARAVESNYLNQLERQGLVRSRRVGRRKIFSLQEDPRNQGLK
jgi:DNA-binding transcriptional ArsR family regulator